MGNIEKIIEEKLQRLTLLGSRPGLDRIQALLEALGSPQRGLQAIHVAGTNGKGSTCWMMTSILEHAGYRVGSFLSPHICSYRERFAVNGQYITAQDLSSCLDRVLAQVPALLEAGLDHPTEFEILTALAFEYFRDQAVEVAVMEVGMGGRFDSTNVLTPLVSVITSIDYDHMAYLGDTLEDITWNKAGIIKPGIPVVIGELPSQALDVIELYCQSAQSPLYYSSMFHIQRHNLQESSLLDISGPELTLRAAPFSLLGDFQMENLAIVLTTLHLLKGLGFTVSSSDIAASLAAISLPGRMQILMQEPLIIADAAHNPHGCRALAASLEHLWPGRGRVLVCGMVDDKDARTALDALGSGTRVCIITRPAGERAEQWQRLGTIWQSLFPDKEVHLVEDPIQAVQMAMVILKPEEYMLISGSFYLLGPVYLNCGNLTANS